MLLDSAYIGCLHGAANRRPKDRSLSWQHVSLAWRFVNTESQYILRLNSFHVFFNLRFGQFSPISGYVTLAFVVIDLRWFFFYLFLFNLFLKIKCKSICNGNHAKD